MKKSLILVMLILACLMIFISCTDKNGDTDTATNTGSDEHKHTYSTDWSYDISGHWHDAECCHTEDRIEFSEHLDNDGDGACDACGLSPQD